MPATLSRSGEIPVLPSGIQIPYGTAESSQYGRVEVKMLTGLPEGDFMQLKLHGGPEFKRFIFKEMIDSKQFRLRAQEPKGVPLTTDVFYVEVPTATLEAGTVEDAAKNLTQFLGALRIKQTELLRSVGSTEFTLTEDVLAGLGSEVHIPASDDTLPNDWNRPVTTRQPQEKPGNEGLVSSLVDKVVTTLEASGINFTEDQRIALLLALYTAISDDLIQHGVDLKPGTQPSNVTGADKPKDIEPGHYY